MEIPFPSGISDVLWESALCNMLQSSYINKTVIYAKDMSLYLRLLSSGTDKILMQM